MIQSFGCKKTESLFRRVSVHPAWHSIASAALRKLSYVHAVRSAKDLQVPPGNRLEKLKGDRAGQYSIRINNQWRICFEFKGEDAYHVEIVDYH